MAEFLVTASEGFAFKNEELNKATVFIYGLGENIKKNWFAIARAVAKVDRLECYKDDGFNNVHEWVNKTFGLKKSASYSLLSIGREYVAESFDKNGKLIGYGTNLVQLGDDDFSKTQVEKMLPIGHSMALELVENGEITPYMSAKQISDVVKTYKKGEEEEEEGVIDVEEVEGEVEEVANVSVWDNSGIEYIIPANILDKYRI